MRTVPLIGMELPVDLEEQNGRIARAETVHLPVPQLIRATYLDNADLLGSRELYNFQRTSSHCSGRGDKSFKREVGASVRPSVNTSKPLAPGSSGSRGPITCTAILAATSSIVSSVSTATRRAMQSPTNRP